MARKRGSQNPIVARMAELAIRLWNAEEGILDDLRRMGFQFELKENGNLIFQNPHGGIAGWHFSPQYCDPWAAAATLGFAIAGIYWPMVFPGLMEETTRLAKSFAKFQSKKEVQDATDEHDAP